MSAAIDKMLQDVPSVRRLYYSREASFDERIYELTELEELTISDCDFSLLPEGISRLTKLRSLSLRATPLRELPADIVRLQGLEYLCIERTKIATLPQRAVASPMLKTLVLSGNKLSELPDYLGSYEHLETLYLEKTPLKKFPNFVLHFPKLRVLMCKGCTGFHKNFQREGQAEIFFRALRQRVPERLWEDVYWLFSGDDAACEGLSLEALLVGVQFVNPAQVRQTASRLLQRRVAAQYAENPLRAGAILAIFGKPAFDRAQLKQQLEAKGVSVRERWTEDCTHILLGGGFSVPQRERIAELTAQGARVQLMLDEQVSAFFREAGEFYLAPPTAQAAETAEASAQYVESLRSLLRSHDESNTDLALEMMHTGGAPQRVFCELFMTAKSSKSTQQQRKKARDLLKKFAPKGLYELAKVHNAVTSYEGYLSTSISQALHEGLLPWRDLLDYDRACSTHKAEHAFWLKVLPEAAAMEYLNEVFTADSDAVLRICQINVAQRERYCPLPLVKRIVYTHYRTLPPILEAMPQVEHLSCTLHSDDSKNSLPRILQLKRLQSLDILDCTCATLPDSLYQMPALQRIAIHAWQGVNPSYIAEDQLANLPANWSYSPQGNGWLLQRNSP